MSTSITKLLCAVLILVFLTSNGYDEKWAKYQPSHEKVFEIQLK